jgi:hypothetical protein
VITQAGGKVFELVKDGGKVLLKEGREELGKALTGPRLEPALAGPTARLPQAPNRDLPNVFFSKKTGTGGGGGGGKPAPKPEPPKSERIINIPEDCTKYIDNKVSSGICRKHRSIDGRETYEVIKKDGLLKKGDLLTRDTRHHEWELLTERGKHKGAIDPKTGELYKPADPTKQLNVK